ncbi:SpvB/TcaC N-terminal domain-containing protein [Sorangium sp. So ce295]|uniref:SpvB/TcaC N-terminal domain-containing protein n=1 Tax=Sorangium sp. So ce295 TaxID=3133295 RepID=UPI003F605422
MTASDERKPSTSVAGAKPAAGPERSGPGDAAAPRAESKAPGQESPIQGLLPALSLPKGGGAIQGMGEKFSTNPVTGTGGFSVPIAISPGRPGFPLALGIRYDSGAANGPFGLGWQLGVLAITRKTDKGLPRYAESEEHCDVFLLAGAEDLVPLRLSPEHDAPVDEFERGEFTVRRYRPRTESGFARIERWTSRANGDVHFQVTTRQNLLQVFGRTAKTRVTEPEHPDRVFSWLLEETRDDRGNVAHYEYKQEDGAGVDPSVASEAHRFEACDGRAPRFLVTAQRYLKRLRYGNRTPVSGFDGPLPPADDFLFEVVFDYGEHDPERPTPHEERPWRLRADPFSSYRAGFEVRSYRLCQRVLMFHRFAELGPEPYLVRSTDFTYDEGPVFSYLRAATQVAYERAPGADAYTRATLPALEFAYSRPELHDELKTLSKAALEGMPFGPESVGGQWVDLDGEGLPGVLIPGERAWFYKANQGGGMLAPPVLERTLPAPAELRQGVQQLTDLDHDGRLDLVQYARPLAGYFEREAEHRWAPFAALPQVPNIDWHDPNLRFLDLDGDGLPDVLITEHDALVWYRSRAKQGFEPAQRVNKPHDESRGPALVFADASEAIQFADMSGDGLSDLVRVRAGEVCYWPNLGYGRFGRKITLAQGARLDAPEQFDPRRVRLFDVDGSGTSDIVYLGRDGVRIHFNQAGNSLSAPRVLSALPPVDHPASFHVVDLLGQGTACLVWSSPLSTNVHPVRYVDILGGKKPHLLIAAINNLGAETRIGYASSTQFYLADKAAGRPWITRLPFPVHVVQRVEHLDRVSGTALVRRFAYRHGFYDGHEREFAGFACTEQWDAESFSGDKGKGLFADLPYDRTPDDDRLDLPPVRTVSWFHTGAWLARERLETALAREFYAADPLAPPLDSPLLPRGLSTREEREAARALRGLLLRQEIYAEDGTARAAHPYTVSTTSYEVRLVQRAAQHAHAAFFVHPQSSLSLHYERNPHDPRMQQELVLSVDAFGNVTESVTISYPRREPAFPEQARTWSTLRRSRVANVTEERSYRLGVPHEAETFELTGLPAPERVHQVLSREAARIFLAETRVLPFEALPDPEVPAARLIQRDRYTYYRDDLSGALPLGSIGVRALPFQSAKQAFTPGLLADAYGLRVDSELLEADGGYLFEDGAWWAVSGHAVFDRERFYLPVEAFDRFGNRYRTVYDAYALLPMESIDPLGNRISVGERDAQGTLTKSGLDYRVLAPVLITDPNQNRTAVRLDTLGMPIATAWMGKAGAGEGDTLDDPTIRFEYDLHRYVRTGGRQPVFARELAREEHGAGNARWQETYSYSDGSGRNVLRKMRAEAGRVPVLSADGSLSRLPDGRLALQRVEQRWLGTGRTVFDNKGNPLKQYEPFFSATSDFETERALVEWGVTAILRYDPLGRLVRSDLPDGTHVDTVFDAWHKQLWDQNDGIQGTPWLSRFQAGSADQKRCAALVLAHAATPARQYLDGLGRPFLTVADNGPAGEQPTRLELDIQGMQRSLTDARGNLIVRQVFDMLGRAVRVVRADAGEASADDGRRAVAIADDAEGGRSLFDCHGAPLRIWTERGFRLRTEYDALRRTTSVWLDDGRGEKRSQLRRYGEAHPRAEELNLRGRLHLAFDGAGLVINERFDFKGNLTECARRLAREYRDVPDWSSVEPRPGAELDSAEALIEPERFAEQTRHDALNRVTSHVTPDHSEHRPTYNERSLLLRVDVRLRGAEEWITLVERVAYNARGQRECVRYGNGSQTRYEYDPFTFRLVRQHTRRDADDVLLQDLSYVLDPVGNIASIRDAVSYGNSGVSGDSLYEYDAVYQLTRAEGREHGGQLSSPKDSSELGLPQAAHARDWGGLRRYRETYAYDPAGNLVQMAHRPLAPGAGGWTRRYRYAADCNRLLATSVPGDTHDEASARYTYDVAGNMASMPHLPQLRWDYAERLQRVRKQAGTDASAPNEVYFTYGDGGQRVRKVYEHGAFVEERIYLGSFELYRKRHRASGELELERESLHVMDDRRRVALIETKTVDTSASRVEPTPRQRFQLESNLGSATLELDERGKIISYEEYVPFGSTAFRAADGCAEVAAKRYRYTGKERDEETGLYAFGARYYAPWLGRWTSPDPAGVYDGPNIYMYVGNNPINRVDSTGLWQIDWGEVAIGAVAAIAIVAVVAVTAGAAAPVIAGGLTTALTTAGLSTAAATTTVSALGTAVVATGTVYGAVGVAETVHDLSTGVNSRTGQPLTDVEGSRRLGALPVEIVATALGARTLGGGPPPSVSLPRPVLSFEPTFQGTAQMSWAAEAVPVVTQPGVAAAAPPLLMMMSGGGGGGGSEPPPSSESSAPPPAPEPEITPPSHQLPPPSLGDVIARNYQRYYNDAWLRVVAKFNRGEIQIPPELNWRTVLGQRTDAYARARLRNFLAREGIPEGPGEDVLVNRFLRDPSGSGAYRIPDVRINSEQLILDGTIGVKTPTTPQIVDFVNFSGGFGVRVIRPQVGPLSGSGTSGSTP